MTEIALCSKLINLNTCVLVKMKSLLKRGIKKISEKRKATKRRLGEKPKGIKRTITKIAQRQRNKYTIFKPCFTLDKIFFAREKMLFIVQ